MLIEQIDDIDAEALERGFGDFLDVLGPAVERVRSGFAVGVHAEAELGGDDQLIAQGRQCFAEQFFICERAVDLCGIEECDAALHGCMKEGDHLLLIFGRPVGKTHSHASEAKCRYFKFAVSQFAFLHLLLLCVSRSEDDCARQIRPSDLNYF